MKKVILSVAQFAILLKVQEQISFQFDEVDKFIAENNGKEEFPELAIDQAEYDDMIDSIKQFEGSLEEGEEKAEVTKWLEELTAEPAAETAAEEVAATTEPVVESAAEPAENVTEPGTETEKQE